MVDDTDIGENSETGAKHESICPSLLVEPHNLNESVFIYVNNNTTVTDHGNLYFNLNQTETRPSSDDEKPVGQTFRWNEKDQGLVLGSFFWGYMVSQFPAGLLAYKYGGKWVGGLGMVWTGLLSIALPQAAQVGGRDFVILVRVLQGFSSVSSFCYGKFFSNCTARNTAPISLSMISHYPYVIFTGFRSSIACCPPCKMDTSSRACTIIRNVHGGPSIWHSNDNDSLWIPDPCIRLAFRFLCTRLYNHSLVSYVVLYCTLISGR